MCRIIVFNIIKLLKCINDENKIIKGFYNEDLFVVSVGIYIRVCVLVISIDLVLIIKIR